MGVAEPSFEEVYDEYWREIYLYVAGRVGNLDDAEDITALTFLRAFAAYPQFRSENKASLPAWLKRIAHNLIVDEYRRSSKERWTVSLESVLGGNIVGSQFEAVVIRRETLNWAISQLRPQYREIVVLRFVAGYGYQEIADILGMPVGTVKSSLHRALRQLGGILVQRVE